MVRSGILPFEIMHMESGKSQSPQTKNYSLIISCFPEESWGPQSPH